MRRIVQPELLDSLPPDDPRAVHSRRDLRRVNACMGNHSMMARELESRMETGFSTRIMELGAGDGNFLLRVAKIISPRHRNVAATLLDLQNNVSTETVAAFNELGWSAKFVIEDAFEWLKSAGPCDVVIANLFLHHFEDARLAELLRLISKSANLFIAIEPRRGAWALFVSRLLWFIGCNKVTRHDAVVSVRAGFSGRELSALWPEAQNWSLEEYGAGEFSHLFVARKIN